MCFILESALARRGAARAGRLPPHCSADTDGQVTDTSGPTASAWYDLQLFHLNRNEGTELLQVIRTARGAGEPPLPAFAPTLIRSPPPTASMGTGVSRRPSLPGSRYGTGPS